MRVFVIELKTGGQTWNKLVTTPEILESVLENRGMTKQIFNGDYSKEYVNPNNTTETAVVMEYNVIGS